MRAGVGAALHAETRMGRGYPIVNICCILAQMSSLVSTKGRLEDVGSPDAVRVRLLEQSVVSPPAPDVSGREHDGSSQFWRS